MVIWLGHFALGVTLVAGAWLSDDSERIPVLVWCAFIVVVIPPAVLAMNRMQSLEVSERFVTVRGAGASFHRRFSRSAPLELNLISGCWGAYDLLVLKWGRFPWQSVYFAPLARTDDKKTIGKRVSSFLTANCIEFASNFETSGYNGDRDDSSNGGLHSSLNSGFHPRCGS